MNVQLPMSNIDRDRFARIDFDLYAFDVQSSVFDVQSST